MHDRDRRCYFRLARNIDNAAARAQRLVERNHRVIGAERIGLALGKRDAGGKRIRKLGDVMTPKQHDMRRCETLSAGEPALRGVDIGAVRRRQNRRRIGHRRAQVRIVPGLDPPRRQPAFGETRERRFADRRGDPPFLLGELLREGRFRRRVRTHMDGHRRLRRPRRRNRDIRCARVRAPVPDRRSRRSAPSTSHARRPA